jgi:hypothetical protein
MVTNQFYSKNDDSKPSTSEEEQKTKDGDKLDPYDSEGDDRTTPPNPHPLTILLYSILKFKRKVVLRLQLQRLR